MGAKTTIHFTEDLQDFFWNEQLIGLLKRAKVVSEKSQGVWTIVHNNEHVLKFTKDRKSVMFRFGVKINNKSGNFIFIIKLSDSVISKNLDLTKGLCLIEHEDFEHDGIYSVRGTYEKKLKTLVLDKVKML